MDASRLHRGVSVVLGLMLWGSVAPGASASWVGRAAEDLAGVQIPLDEDSCTALSGDGNETLWVLSPEEAPGHAMLLGLSAVEGGDDLQREPTVLWETPLPWLDEYGGLNTAKAWASCDGRQLTLYSQVPYWAATFIQTFEWNGQALKFLSHGFVDPSADILEAAIAAVETQEFSGVAPNGLESPLEGLVYPQNYIHGDALDAAMTRGHLAALARYEAGEVEVAAKILWEMFELTRSLHGLVGHTPIGSSPGVNLNSAAESDFETASSLLKYWVAVWWEQEIPWQTYVPALNDYGFFLQEQGDHGEAIAVFEAVVELAPKRTVAYLNLADSQWRVGQFSRARQAYQVYRRQMIQQGLSSQIPLRVMQRQSLVVLSDGAVPLSGTVGGASIGIAHG